MSGKWNFFLFHYLLQGSSNFDELEKLVKMQIHGPTLKASDWPHWDEPPTCICAQAFQVIDIAWSEDQILRITDVL